ncbi:MAG: hypothetical protein ACYC1U_06900 [Candidatus Aquicultorales bacterium]
MDASTIPSVVTQLGAAAVLGWVVIQWGKNTINRQADQLKAAHEEQLKIQQKAYEDAVESLRCKERKLEERNDKIFMLMEGLLGETKVALENNTAALHRISDVIERCPGAVEVPVAR